MIKKLENPLDAYTILGLGIKLNEIIAWINNHTSDVYSMKQKPLNVKITKCSGDLYWYKDYINKNFEVIEKDNEDYEVVDINNINNKKWDDNKFYIMKKDCEVIKEDNQEENSCIGCQFEHSPIIFCADCSDRSMYEPIQKSKEQDWKKLLEQLKNILNKESTDCYFFDFNREYKEFKAFIIQVISFMEKEIEKQNDYALEYCEKCYELERENQQLKQEIKQKLKKYEDIIDKQDDMIIQQDTEIEKLKRYNGNLLNDKIMIQKANKNLKKQINQLIDEINSQIKIDDDIVKYIENEIRIGKLHWDDEIKMKIEMLERLLQQLNIKE